MTVAELLDRISSDELTQWQAYELAHGPLGPLRGDWQAALIASTLVAVNRTKKGRQPKVADFLLAWKGNEAQDPKETERVGRMLASRLGGTWTEATVVGGERDE